MSHTLFLNSMLCNARVWAWLHEVDEAEAAHCREAGCRHCDGELHSATYPRKPYGLAPALRGEGTRRFSYCCAACRRRATPASVRFFGRRFYVGGLFLLVSALALRGGVRLETIGRKWRIPVVTLRRWRRWWQEAFPATGPWREKRGGFWLPCDRNRPALVILTESAVDAISARRLRIEGTREHGAVVASTAGIARAVPPWIEEWKPRRIICAYDADSAGDHAAERLQVSDPRVTRLRPLGAKDWNEILARSR